MDISLEKIYEEISKINDSCINHINRKGEIDYIQIPITENNSVHYEITRKKVFLDFELNEKKENIKVTEQINLENDPDFVWLWKNHPNWLRIGFKKNKENINLSNLKKALDSINDYINQYRDRFVCKLKLADENLDLLQEDYIEGTKLKSFVTSYERNKRARKKCLEYYGYKCSVCGFDFEREYGKIGEGFIHVHHIVSVASVGKEYKIDPVKDLRPVCANCHAMLHRKSPVPYTISELKEMRK